MLIFFWLFVISSFICILCAERTLIFTKWNTQFCLHTSKNTFPSMFGSVVAGAFQITFRAKMHANDVFSFLKNYFWYQHIKTIQTIQTILNFSKKKKSNFLGTQPQPRSQTSPKSHHQYGQSECASGMSSSIYVLTVIYLI